MDCDQTYNDALVWTQIQRVLNSKDKNCDPKNPFRRVALVPGHKMEGSDPALYMFSKFHSQAISPPSQEVLTAALQEAFAEIAALTTRVETLEGN